MMPPAANEMRRVSDTPGKCGKYMKNLKIGKKLLVTFGVIIILFCVTVVVSILSLNQTGENFKTFYDSPFQVSNKASDMRTSIQATGKYIGYAMMVDDPVKTAEYVKGAQDELQSLTDDITFMKKNFQGEEALLTKYDSVMAGLAADQEKVLSLALNNENAEATSLYFDKVMPELVEAQEYLIQINDSAMDQASGVYKDSMNKKNLTTIILIALSAVVLIATIGLALYITKSLTGPIREIESAAKDLASGKLDTHIQYESKDELGSLAGSMRITVGRLASIITDLGYLLKESAGGNFNAHTKNEEGYVGEFKPLLLMLRQMNTDLSETIGQINESADQVSSGSDQVSSGAQALSQGATEQASAVEELAATINEISEQVRSNAESAQMASSTVSEVGGKLLESNQQMKEMTNAMSEISASSGQIGKIIKTIEDIAFQTNILALNAAVEAARAGAAGKGFAVVADEVRNLASKSSEASKNTSALIESSLRSVDNGTRIADSTAASLLAVVDGTKEITSQINLIAEASREQASSILQVTQGVDQISSVVQTNSATSEESAASSEELSGQAQILKDLVSRFKLKDTGRMKTEEAVSSASQHNSLYTSHSGSGRNVMPVGSKY